MNTSDRVIASIKRGMLRHDTDYDDCMLDGAEYMRGQLSRRALELLGQAEVSNDPGCRDHLRRAFSDLGLIPEKRE